MVYNKEKEATLSIDPVGLYLTEIGQIPLLPPEKELEIGQKIDSGRSAQEKLSQDGNLSREEKEELEKQIAEGEEAMEALVKANFRLVVSIAKKYQGRGVSFLDLIQEGNTGLLTAVDRYDHRRGCKFPTYATWWIRQKIIRAVATQGRTIRLPVHQFELVGEIRRIQHEFLQEQGREPTVEELAERLKKPVERIKQLLEISLQPVSLDIPVGKDKYDSREAGSLGDFIKDETAIDPTESIADDLLRERLENLLNGLTPQQARVLQLRFGLVDGQTHTLAEVGQKLGLTRERVRQIEAEALKRLRHPCRSRKLKEFHEGR